MSFIDIFTSFRDLGLSSVTLSSMVLWPVLMNWRSMVSYVPSLERFVSQNEERVSDAIRSFLTSWYGALFVVAMGAVVLCYLGHTVWKSLRAIVLANWHTTCSIPQNCTAYDQVLAWVKENPKLRGGIVFRASAESSRKDLGDSGVDFTRPGMTSVDDIRKIKEGQNSVSLDPTIDTIRFWHNGAYFWLKNRHATKLNSGGVHVPDVYLEIYCFTWNLSIDPISSFLKMIDKQDNDDFSEHTQICVPFAPYYRGGSWFWRVHRYRHKRQLHTVLIDPYQMDTLIAQVRSFLSCSGVRWFRNKGLPLRLGYLFSGPPGTGKSSLAFALAGNFGLPVYVLSLSLPALTDKGVEELFASIPFHCIVLMEDIDATKPLTRTGLAVKAPADDDSEDEDQEPKNTVTLSGLLNAIDGVGAAEGRILIMTTNNIEILDEALIRTGRADVIVNFTNVTKKQAVGMFTNTYSGERWIPYQPGKPGVEDWTEDDIKRLAEEFGAKIHDQEFSPALLQQYFKDFRVEPRRAVQEVDKWMEDPRGYRKHGLPVQQHSAQQHPAQKHPAQQHPPQQAAVVKPDAEAEAENSQKELSIWDFIDCST